MLSQARPSGATLPIDRRTQRGGVARASLELAVLRLFAPVDIASIVAFRIAFGAIMLIETFGYLGSDLIATDFIDPAVHFPFVGLEWVRPWPGVGMYIHFWVLGAAAFGMMVGYCYRMCAAVFCLGFTYVFLLEKAYYLNHFYLVCLLSFLLIFVPAQGAFSIDALHRPAIRSQSAPTWALWLLRSQLAIVYIFGGVAKLNGDWLRGEPMRQWLAEERDFPLIGRLFDAEWMVYAFSFGGLLLDLLVVPLLLWPRSRLVALVLVTTFHLVNAKLFQIGIFPWFMIAATILFLPPELPRSTLLHGNRWLVASRRIATWDTARTEAFAPRGSLGRSVIAGTIAIYLTVQVVVPLRHFAYPGNVSWTEEGHRFSWHMKLRSKSGDIRFFVTDPATGATQEIDPDRYLTPLQAEKMAFHPDMILQFSHFLADELSYNDGARPEVRVCALVALNGREPHLLIDPTVDLASVRHSLAPADWILPLSDDAPRSCIPS